MDGLLAPLGLSGELDWPDCRSDATAFGVWLRSRKKEEQWKTRTATVYVGALLPEGWRARGYTGGDIGRFVMGLPLQNNEE